MARLPPFADTVFDTSRAGTPILTSKSFKDIYFSPEDGLGEARHVFLKGAALLRSWRASKDFTIAETGFGTGLNFLSVWDLWRNTPEDKRPERLDFISFEAFPLAADIAEKALTPFEDIRPLSKALIDNWPTRARLLQHRSFEEGAIHLHLVMDDILAGLQAHAFKADAWFLDGFAPSQNEAMWSDEVFKAIAEHSAPKARLATFSAAGFVKRALQHNGFIVEKITGFGRKREQITAQFDEAPSIVSHREPLKNIAIIGGGIAGVMMAHRLKSSKAEITLYDPAGIGSGASGNPYALVMPRLDSHTTRESLFHLSCFLEAHHFYSKLDITPEAVIPLKMRQQALTERDEGRFDRIRQDMPLDDAFLEVCQQNGLELHHLNALLIEPPKILTALATNINLIKEEVTHIDETGNIKTAQGEKTFDKIIICAGLKSLDFLKSEDFPLYGRRGQINWGKALSDSLEATGIIKGKFAVSVGQIGIFGSDFTASSNTEAAIGDTNIRKETLAEVAKFAPEFATRIETETLKSRAALRVMSPDQMPLCGVSHGLADVKKAYRENKHEALLSGDLAVDKKIYLLTGLGARGFTLAPWLTRHLASEIMDEEPIYNRDIKKALSPSRFMIKRLRKEAI